MKVMKYFYLQAHEFLLFQVEFLKHVSFPLFEMSIFAGKLTFLMKILIRARNNTVFLPNLSNQRDITVPNRYFSKILLHLNVTLFT